MNLLSNIQRPILDCLTRIYRHNGYWVQTTRQYQQRKIGQRGFDSLPSIFPTPLCAPPVACPETGTEKGYRLEKSLNKNME